MLFLGLCLEEHRQEEKVLGAVGAGYFGCGLAETPASCGTGPEIGLGPQVALSVTLFSDSDLGYFEAVVGGCSCGFLSPCAAKQSHGVCEHLVLLQELGKAGRRVWDHIALSYCPALPVGSVSLGFLAITLHPWDLLQ